MAGTLPPILSVLRANAAQFTATYKEAAATAEETSAKVDASGSRAASALNKTAALGKAALLGVGAGAAIIGVASVKMATNFQEATTSLVTGAGESEEAIGGVSKGILAMAGSVGTTPQDLAKGMYLIESAGYHASAGLTVLKAAAQGAKVGAADLNTVADGLTTAMTDYKIPAAQAATVTSQLVKTVASGKTTMADLSGSLHNVLPAAAAAHLGLSQVLGAMATMTGQGISADQASQDLASTIRSLQAPTQEQVTEMESLGLSSTKVATQLGQQGLTGTLGTLVSAITSKMGPAGTVILSTFKQAQSASEDANTELSKMPKSLQAVAKGYQAGTITSTQWRADLKGMTVDNKQLAQQFATTVNQSKGFNDLLKSGSPQAQTFAAALSKLTGGATGMNTALALTGTNLATFQSNVKGITGATADAKGNVAGFAETSGDLSFKIASAKAAIDALAIKIGNALIPKITQAIDVTKNIVGWFEKHKDAAVTVAAVIGGVLAAAIAIYIGKMAIAGATSLINGAKMIASWFGIGAAATMSAEEAAAAGITMDAAMGPIGIILAAVGVAAILLAKHWKQVWSDIKQWTSDAVGFVKSHMLEIGAGLIILLGPIGILITGILEIALHWKQVWDFVKTAASDIVNFMKQWGPLILAAIVPIIGLPLLIIQHWGVIEEFFKSLPGRIAGYFKSAGTWLLNAGKQIMMGMLNGLYDITIGLDVKIYKWVVANGGLLGLGKKALKVMADGFEAGASAVWDFFKNLPKRILALLAAAGSWLLHTGIIVLKGLWNGITTSAVDTWNFFKQMPGKILSFLGAAASWLLHIGSDIIHGLWTGIVDEAELIWLFFTQLPSSILRQFTNVVGWLYDLGKDIIQGIINGIKDMAGELGGALKGVVKGAIGGLGKIGGKVGSFLGFATGGAVPGAPGVPIPAIVHGGEYVLSTGMINGSSPIDPNITRAVLSNVSRDKSGVSALAAGATYPAAAASGITSGGYTGAPVMSHSSSTTSVSNGGVTVIVQGTVVDTVGLAGAIQSAMLQHGARNSQSYQPFQRGRS